MLYLNQIYLKKFIGKKFFFVILVLNAKKKYFFIFTPHAFKNHFLYRVFKQSNCPVRIILHTLLDQVMSRGSFHVRHDKAGQSVRTSIHQAKKGYFSTCHTK